MKLDSAINSATLIFSSIALSLTLDLEEGFLDLDDLQRLDLLLLDPTDFLDPTFSLFSSASFYHLMIFCLKLNILSSCSSNHWLSARSSSSVSKCWYLSFAALSSFTMPDFLRSLALIFSLVVFSFSNLYSNLFSASFHDLLIVQPLILSAASVSAIFRTPFFY